MAISIFEQWQFSSLNKFPSLNISIFELFPSLNHFHLWTNFHLWAISFVEIFFWRTNKTKLTDKTIYWGSMLPRNKMKVNRETNKIKLRWTAQEVMLSLSLFVRLSVRPYPFCSLSVLEIFRQKAASIYALSVSFVSFVC